MDLKAAAQLVAQKPFRRESAERLWGQPALRFNQLRWTFDDAEVALITACYRGEVPEDERFNYLELSIPRGHRLTLADLNQVFGPDHKLAPDPGGTPWQRGWWFRPATANGATLIVAEFTTDPETEGSHVKVLQMLPQTRDAGTP